MNWGQEESLKMWHQQRGLRDMLDGFLRRLGNNSWNLLNTYTRHCAKRFICIVSLNPHKNSVT